MTKKKPLISVIIPNYNGSKTIKRTLDSLKKQSFKNFEVNIVDDKSTDDSCLVIREIIKNWKNFKLIPLPSNKGAANARNVGSKSANGEILLFTDSDVELKKDALKIVVGALSNKKIDAVVGLPSKDLRFNNAASEHFNLRVHYNYICLPEEINILYTSICAVRRSVFNSINGFDTNIKLASVEDPELGFRLNDAGYKIVSNKDLQVFHHKHLSFFGLLKNDYKRSSARIKLMIRHNMANRIITEKRFISTPLKHILSASIIPLIWVSLLGAIFYKWIVVVTALLLLVFLGLNFGYLKFINKTRGFLLAFKLYFLLIIDMTIVNFGILSGYLNYKAGTKY